MDPNCWIRESYVLRHSRPDTFEFKPAENIVVEYGRGIGDKENRVGKYGPRSLTSDEEWASWFKEWDTTPEASRQDGLSILFAGRAESEGLGRMNLIGMPFSEETFLKVGAAFRIPQSIERTACRNTIAVFSSNVGRDSLTHSPTLEYICRSSASLEDDIMLSMTHVIERRYTYAVFYGCRQKVRNQIIERLDAVEAFHSMLLPTIFADIERDRHITRAKSLHGQLVTKSWNIPSMPGPSTSRGKDIEMRELIEYSTSEEVLQLWADMRQLKNDLLGWQGQLTAMIHHFDAVLRSKPAGASDDAASSNSERTPINTYLVVPEDLGLENIEEDLRNFGARIRHRLCELYEEYSAEARKCSATLELTSLANQIADTRTNFSIAMASNVDSRKMTFISIITMICLPGTFVAGLFSTTFFNWTPDPGEAVISRWFWVYVAIVFAFTGLIGCIWHFYRPYHKNEVEKCEC